MRRVLVTGIAGRLGRAAAVRLAAAGVEVVGLDLQAVSGVPATRLHTGDVSDPQTVREALSGVDAVVHCAAIPAPMLDTPERVFGVNTSSTFTVLEQATQAGVGRVVLASSQSIFGLAFAKVPLSFDYLPVDASHRLQAADAYALSKQVDEATARMFALARDLTVICLRFPFLGGLDDRLPTMAATFAAQPGLGARSLWAYLEDRDAAEVTWQALVAPLSGYHMFLVAAPETLSAQPTAELAAKYLPEVPLRQPLPGRVVPLDLTPAVEQLGFAPRHLWSPP